MLFHRRRPASRGLHLDDRGPGRGERLGGADPQLVSGDAPFDADVAGAAGDDRPHGPDPEASGPDDVADPHAPEHRAVLELGRGEPCPHAPHGRGADVGATAPSPSWSVFECRIASRPEPSSSSARSATLSAAISETRSIASDATATMAASRRPASEPRSARAAARSAWSQRTPATWPRPRPSRRNPARTRAVAGPAGDVVPASFARRRTAATTWPATAGERPASKSCAR